MVNNYIDIHFWNQLENTLDFRKQPQANTRNEVCSIRFAFVSLNPKTQY